MEATLSSTSNLIGWCFLFCPFTHFIWNCIYVTLTLAFYAWQRATYLGISFWYRNLSSFLRVKFPGQFTVLSFLQTWGQLKMPNDVLSIDRPTKKSASWLLQCINSIDQRSLPVEPLSSLTGAMQIHEVTIGSDLSMKKKNLPTDPFFKSVEIKESRKRSSVVPTLE